MITFEARANAPSEVCDPPCLWCVYEMEFLLLGLGWHLTVLIFSLLFVPRGLEKIYSGRWIE